MPLFRKTNEALVETLVKGLVHVDRLKHAFVVVCLRRGHFVDLDLDDVFQLDGVHRLLSVLVCHNVLVDPKVFLVDNHVDPIP